MLNETWLTPNTDVRTVAGWEPINSIRPGAVVLTLSKGKIIPTTVTQVANTHVNTIIRAYGKEVEVVYGKRVFFELNPFKESDFSDYATYHFNGLLYHIRVPENILIVRSYEGYPSNFNEHTFIKCLV